MDEKIGWAVKTSFTAISPRRSAMTQVAGTRLGASEENHPHRCDDKPESGQGGSAYRKLLRVEHNEDRSPLWSTR